MDCHQNNIGQVRAAATRTFKAADTGVEVVEAVAIRNGLRLALELRHLNIQVNPIVSR